MIDRRLSARQLDAVRKDFWHMKQAEADRLDQLDAKAFPQILLKRLGNG